MGLMVLSGAVLFAWGQQLRWLGHPSGRAVVGYALSGDGRVVVGEMPKLECYLEDGCSYSGRTAFRWVVPTGQVEDLFADDEDGRGVALGVSFYGDVVVGCCTGFRWDLEVRDFTYWYMCTARSVSGDGRVVVGGCVQAFRHVWGQQIEQLGTLGGRESMAFDTSWDGSVVVGQAQDSQGNWRAFRWSEATGMQDLGMLFDVHWMGVATGVSYDGQVVVGWTQGFTSRAFRWTPTGGMQALRQLPDRGNTFAWKVSGDGSVVVGWAQVGMEERAVRWRADGQIEDLNVAFRSLLRSGEVLRRAYGVSVDGRYIAGWGERDGVTMAFWLDTRRTGDVDGDGCVDDGDLLRVLFAFGCSASCGAEDVNGDGVVDDTDLLSVLSHFGEGC
jgi:probable HAF family extracellular repeat protein